MMNQDDQKIIYLSEYKRQNPQKLGQIPKLFRPVSEAILDIQRNQQPIPTVHEIQLSDGYWQNFYDD
jgi:hypothetical protein